MNNPKTEERSLFTFLKYILSSVSASVIDLALFHVLCNLLDDVSALRTADLYVTIATFAARIVSATYNYAINYRVVFRSESSKVKSFSRYALLAVIQVCMSAFLVTLLHHMIGGEEVFIKFPVDLTLFVVNYFVQKEIVYKK